MLKIQALDSQGTRYLRSCCCIKLCNTCTSVENLTRCQRVWLWLNVLCYNDLDEEVIPILGLWFVNMSVIYCIKEVAVGFPYHCYQYWHVSDISSMYECRQECVKLEFQYFVNMAYFWCLFKICNCDFTNNVTYNNSQRKCVVE